eukprot:TRINITY_DN77788_c0_g1_i1.p1 TRINITY_DN77788_c0_g1~~TRINITY_DN77788_c0_g1_i1.p1  ORF type:complete len:265 (+),score=61.33 TRINITY_DN77788_c0_g1_i1:83-796(+)
MSGTREENLFFAQLSEQAGRYDDMTHYMTAIAGMGKPLDIHERSLLSLAFKNSVSSRRQAYRHVCALEKELGSVLSDYRQRIKQELEEKCGNILEVLSTKLVVNHDASDVEGAVFYAKMQGDYYRYKAEFSSEGDRQAAVDGAHTCYNDAWEKASVLATTSSVRLGLALNISVFYYEVLGQADEARKLAKQTLEEASQDMHGLDPQSAADSQSIMQLLSENLQQWSDNQDGTEIQDM